MSKSMEHRFLKASGWRFACLWLMFSAISGSYSLSADSAPFPESAKSFMAQEFNTRVLKGKITISEIPPVLTRLLKKSGFSEEEIYSPLLFPRDISYMNRINRLKEIASGVTRGISSDKEKAEAIFNFVVREVVPLVKDDAYDWPEKILARGYGSCDQGAWVFCSLAESLGIRSMLIYLRDSKRGESYHTISALMLDGEWFLYDAFCAINFSAPQRPAPTLGQILENPQIIADLVPPSSQRLIIPEDIQYSVFNMFTTSRGMLPKWLLYESEMRDQSQKGYYFDPADRARKLERYISKHLKPAGGKKNSPKYEIKAYDLPVQVSRYYSSDQWLDKKLNAFPGRKMVARRLSLLRGNSREYHPVTLESNGNGRNAGLVFYAAALAMSLNKYTLASSYFQTIRRRYPKTQWVGQIGYHETICLIRSGASDKEVMEAASRTQAPRSFAAITAAKLYSSKR